jgi:hypothetical protein
MRCEYCDRNSFLETFIVSNLISTCNFHTILTQLSHISGSENLGQKVTENGVRNRPETDSETDPQTDPQTDPKPTQLGGSKMLQNDPHCSALTVKM